MVDYSVTDPDVLADPAPAYARLRAECPVHRAEVDGRALYSVSRATDVHRILVDPAHWSNAKGPGLSYSSSGAGDMQHDDPPEHTRRRKFARDWFGPTAVAELEPAIRDVTSELIEAVRPVGHAELYGDVALPLPVTSFCAILGIDLDDRDRFLEWADEMVVSMAYPEQGRRARHELSAFTAGRDRTPPRRRRRRHRQPARPAHPPRRRRVLGRRRADAARRAGEHGQPAADRRPRDDHVADHQLHVAAARGRARQRWQRVVDDPALIPNAVEESLRFDPPVLGLCRTPNEDTTIDGVDIVAGAKVMVLYASANRDEHRFPDRPDDFVVDRPLLETRKHYSFSWGIHHCLGAHLARLDGARRHRGAGGAAARACASTVNRLGCRRRSSGAASRCPSAG